MNDLKPTLPVRISLYNLAILLHNIVEAHKLYDLEGVDPSRTKEELIRAANKHIYINLELVQLALYHSNLLSEKGKFWHPHQIEFNTFVLRLLPNDLAFDKTYNIVHNKEIKPIIIEERY